MKKPLILFLLCIFFLRPVAGFASDKEEIAEFLRRLQNYFTGGNVSTYLGSYAENLKEEELRRVLRLKESFQLEKTSFHKAHVKELGSSGFQVILLAFFQNSYSVILETWRLRLRRINDRWQIGEKTLIGADRNLYKVNFPGEKVERATFVEINHVDIQIRFTDALVFYDNIPGIETALVVMGEGHVQFSPSSSREKHQLYLTYGTDALNESIEYVYLRFSPSFFENNIKIVREESENFSVSNRDIKKARSLFRRLYPRSFTIENSLTRELLSFLPNGEEAVFEFKGKRRGNLAYIYSPFAEEEVNLYNWKQSRVLNLYSPDVNKEKKRLFVSFEKLFDVENYQLDIFFNPKESYISGQAKVQVKSHINKLDGIKLKLNPDFEILRINDEAGHELFYSRDRLRQFLYIYFHNPMPKDKKGSVEISYRGEIVPDEISEDVVSIFPYQKSYAVSKPKFQTHLYTRSSFWYPAPANEDYFTARLKIIVPPGYSCVANGKLVEKTKVESLDDVIDLEKAGSSVFVYQTENPLKYLAFIVGEFVKVDETLEPLLLQYFRSKDIRIPRMELLKEMSLIINFYQEKFGVYPFEKLCLVHRLWSQGGGHSPPSFIVLNEVPRVPGRRRVEPNKSPVNLTSWKEYLLAHEIAHQWWGQGLSWGSYQDQWLSEGLAQFAAILYLREKYGQDAFGSILKKFSMWTKKKSKWGPISLGSRLSYSDFEAYQAIVYDKSAVVMNMLLDLLGEELFFRGIREFFHRYKYTAARTNDFFRTIQEVSGRELQSFFDGWFNSYHLPKVKATREIHKRDDGYHLKIGVIQSGKVFVFPLWVEWQEDGKKTRRKVLIDKSISKFDFVLDAKPSKVKINPNNAVPGDFN